MSSAARRLRKSLGYILAVLAPVVLAVGHARPHTHVEPDGSRISWYPHECCHDGDCRPVANLAQASGGVWMTTVDGYTIFAAAALKRQLSRDMRWHVCIGRDEVDEQTPKITCIFEPPSS